MISATQLGELKILHKNHNEGVQERTCTNR